MIRKLTNVSQDGTLLLTKKFNANPLLGSDAEDFRSLNTANVLDCLLYKVSSFLLCFLSSHPRMGLKKAGDSSKEPN